MYNRSRHYEPNGIRIFINVWGAKWAIFYGLLLIANYYIKVVYKITILKLERNYFLREV
jgi:hypothetical protein